VEPATTSDDTTPAGDSVREIQQLRARVAELERELVDQAARANAAVAAAESRAYWLDRWHLDLNEVMARPSADRVRRALRAARSVQRRLKTLLRLR
jgi:hypothetical protein